MIEQSRLTKTHHPRIFEVDHTAFLSDGCPEPEERRLARNILSLHAEGIMDKRPAEWILSNYAAEDGYRRLFPNADYRNAEALYHWVSQVWHEDGKTYFQLTNYIN